MWHRVCLAFWPGRLVLVIDAVEGGGCWWVVIFHEVVVYTGKRMKFIYRVVTRQEGYK